MWQLYTFERVCKHFCVKLFENFLQAVFCSRHMLTLKHDSPFKSSVYRRKFRLNFFGRMFSHKKTGKSMMSVNTKPPLNRL